MRRAILPAALTAAVATVALAVVTLSAPAQASAPNGADWAVHRTTTETNERADAERHVAQALDTIRKMNTDPHIETLLARSKGVFVIPDYGFASLVVGSQDGAGVLLTHLNGRWFGPAFYKTGGVSIGAQATIAGGRIAMILMDQKALDSFGTLHQFSLDLETSLTVIAASARGKATARRGDIVAWSDTADLSGKLFVGVGDIRYDADETHAYYGRAVSPVAVVRGNLASPRARTLLDLLPV